MDSYRLVDSHCHLSFEPRDLDPENDNVKDIINKRLDLERENEGQLVLNIMSTTHFDHELLFKNEVFDEKHGVYKLGLGVHPWYSYLYTFEKNTSKLDHYLSILSVEHKEVAKKLGVEITETAKIEEFIKETITKNCYLYPEIHYIRDIYTDEVFLKYDFVGEVGLDFKAVATKIADNSDGLDFRVSRGHQLNIFEFFVDKFTENQSNLKFISIHSVKASQATFDTMKLIDKKLQDMNKKANIVLHSYNGTIDQFNQQYLKLKNINSFISLSGYINCKLPLTNKQKTLISKLEVKNMLIETDVPINTEMEGFCFKLDLERTLEVIKNLKANISLNELKTEINNNYARIMGGLEF